MKKSTSATVEFFRAIGAKNVRSYEQVPDALRARLPESEVKEVIDHINEEKYWGNLSAEELEAMESFRNVSYERSLAISLVHYYSRTREMFTFYESRRPFLGGRILEVGCRNGMLSSFLGFLRPEAKVVGIDSLPFGIPHGRRIAEDLRLANVKFEQSALGEYAADERFDTIVLTRPMARYGFMCMSYANYMSLMSAAQENAKAYAAFAKAVSDRLKVGGFLFFSDVCAYDSTFLGMLLALANVGIVWRGRDSNRGAALTIEDRPVSQVNGYDLVFEKKSEGLEEIDGIVKDFLDDAYTDEVEGHPGLYVKENADAVMHLHAGKVIAGFTSTFDFEDGGAEGVAVVAWKDRSDAVVWLEMQCSCSCSVFRFPADKEAWVAGEVWANAHLVAKDCPDVFERLSGVYDDLDVEKITDAALLPEGNPDKVDSGDDVDDRDEGGSPVLPTPALSIPGSSFPASSFPTAGDFKLKLTPLDGSFMKKESPSSVDAKTSAVISSMIKASKSTKVPVTDGTGYSDIGGFRVMRPPMMDERPRRKKPTEQVPESAPASRQERKESDPPVAGGQVGIPAKRTLRLTFISKSGRLNVENMETGCQWRADSSGVRIEDESVGHVASRRIEDTDFTMTTSAGQIVLRDDACGYEFTIRLG